MGVLLGGWKKVRQGGLGEERRDEELKGGKETITKGEKRRRCEDGKDERMMGREGGKRVCEMKRWT